MTSMENRKENYITKINSLILGSYFILKPFYFFESGIPQISDFVLVIAFITTIYSNDFYMDLKTKRILFWNYIFVTYIVVTNSLWGIYLGGVIEPIKYSFYYVFNFFVILLLVDLYNKMGDRLLKVIDTSIIISLSIQLIFLITNQGFKSYRTLLFFNNPNQLGYFGLLCMVLGIIIHYRLNTHILKVLSILVMSSILTLISLSKAAIVSAITAILCFAIVYLKKQQAVKTIIIILIIALTIPFLNNTYINLSVLQLAQERVLEIGSDNDDNLRGRGYDRILNHPQYLIFGAGEGLTERFISKIEAEIHSTFGTILFSYGLIGFILFLIIITICIYNKRPTYMYPLGSIFLYSLAHNGIRQSLFWIIIIVVSMITEVES